MDFNKLTQKSQEAFTEAQNKAVSFGHVEVDGEHLLWALLDQPDGLVPRLLQRMDIRPEMVKNEVVAELDRIPRVSGPGAEAGKIYVSQRLSRILVAAENAQPGAAEVAFQPAADAEAPLPALPANLFLVSHRVFLPRPVVAACYPLSVPLAGVFEEMAVGVILKTRILRNSLRNSSTDSGPALYAASALIASPL